MPVVRSDPIGVEPDQPEVYLSEDESESDGQDNLFERYAGDLDRQIHSDSDSDSDSPPGNIGGEPKNISIGELLLNLFDLVAAHKATKSLTRDIWSVISLAVPAGTDIASYKIAEQIVRAHIRESVVVLL